MKVLASLAAILFGYSAVVQLNDPDPLRWLLLYGTAATLAALSIFRPVPRLVFVGLASLAGLWAVVLLPEVWSAAALTGTEEERELAGLVLVVAASAALAWWAPVPPQSHGAH